jgi:hypothetical protein
MFSAAGMGERKKSQGKHIFQPKMSSEQFNPKLCQDKNNKYFPSIQIYTTKKFHYKNKRRKK